MNCSDFSYKKTLKMSSMKFEYFYFISLLFLLSLISLLDAQIENDVDFILFDLDNEEHNLERSSEKHYGFSSSHGGRRIKLNTKKSKRKLPKFFKKSFDLNITVTNNDVESFIKVSRLLLQERKTEAVHSERLTVECGNNKSKVEHTVDGSEVVIETNQFDAQEISFNSILYKEPSAWSACTRSCKTRRTRECRLPGICSEDVKVEEAYCYFPESSCEQVIKEILQSQDGDAIYTYDENQNYHTEYDDYTHHVHEDDYYNLWGDATEAIPDDGNYDVPEESDAEVFQSPPVEDELRVDEPSSSAGGECGRAFVSAPSKMFKIIGGKEAVKGSWPWQVAILDRFKNIYCGGTLIGQRWIVTAAHCVQRKMSVRILDHDKNIKDGEREIKVQKSYIYPEFDIDTYDSDIALLKLKFDVTKDPSKPIRVPCLPEINKNLPKKETCVVLGWGKEKEYHRYGSDVLRYAKVPIVGNKACQRGYEYHEITRNMFCAGYLNGGIDTCEGDSGGPLLCQNKAERWVIHGITSFGEGCGRKGLLGVYVKVSNYMAWINDTMSNY